MENNNSKLKKFICYNKAFLNYEQYKKELFSKTRVTNKFIYSKGYLINLNDINNFKQNIKHEEAKIINEEKMKSIFDENLFDNIKEVSQIKYKTSDYLKNMLLNGNKYILISQELWNIIYDKTNQNNEGPIIFKINKNKIVLSLKNEQLTLSHRDFIFDFYSCGGNNSCDSFSEIQKLYDSIYNYCIFETNFSKYLKSNSKHSDKGYLIKKIWIDEWKKYSNYEEIKNKHFIENNPVFFTQKKKR